MSGAQQAKGNLPEETPKEDEIRAQAREVFRLVLAKLRARLEGEKPLTGAELQAALRFCSDNGITLRDRSVFPELRAAPKRFNYGPLPFPAPGEEPDQAGPPARYQPFGPEEE